MDVAAETTRKQRGTKRVCRECAARFYDLGRDPVVCPACGMSAALAAYLPVAEPTRSGGHGSRGWGAPRPQHTVVQAEEAVEPVLADDDDVDKAEDEATAEDDALLETEEGDDDVADLIVPDEEKPTEE